MRNAGGDPPIVALLLRLVGSADGRQLADLNVVAILGGRLEVIEAAF